MFRSFRLLPNYYYFKILPSQFRFMTPCGVSTHSFKKLGLGGWAGELAQWLRALAALTKYTQVHFPASTCQLTATC